MVLTRRQQSVIACYGRTGHDTTFRSIIKEEKRYGYVSNQYNIHIIAIMPTDIHIYINVRYSYSYYIHEIEMKQK